MECQFEKAVSLLANQRGLNFRYRNFLVQRLVDPLSDDIHHFRVSRLDSSELPGAGSDWNKLLALKKAFAEFCERSASVRHGGSGFACHRTQFEAQKHALTEVIERDILLTSWFSKTSPIWLTDHQIEMMATVRSQFRLFQINKFKVRLGVVGTANGLIVCVGTLRPHDGCQFQFYNVLASAAGETVEQVAEKLMADLRRSVGFLLLPENEKFIERNQLKIPSDHLRYYAFNPQSKAEFDWYYDHSEDQNIRIFDDVGDVKYIEHPNPYFDDVPYYMYQAVPASGTFQDYFAGIPNAQKINFNRLRQMGITDLSSINSSPHPLG